MKRDDRHDSELYGLIDGEHAAAAMFWDQLGNVGVDGDELDADANPRNEAP